MPKPFRIEVLSREHDVARFSSGDEAIDRCLRQFARQDVRRRVTTVFVLVDNANDHAAGFYSLPITPGHSSPRPSR